MCGESEAVPTIDFLGLEEKSIRDLPIVETVLLSIKTNNTVKSILKLGCHCLIAYSRYRKDL